MLKRKARYSFLAAVLAFCMLLLQVTPAAAKDTVTYQIGMSNSGQVYTYESYSLYLMKFVNQSYVGTVDEVTYRSSDTAVASVNSLGDFTAKKAGNVKVTAVYQGKNYEMNVKVHKAELTDFSYQQTIYLPKGSETDLRVFGIKNNAKITYAATSDSRIVRIDRDDDGEEIEAKAVGKGTAQIRAKAGGKTYSVKIVVMDRVDAEATNLKFTTASNHYAVTMQVKNTGAKDLILPADQMVFGDDDGFGYATLSPEKDVTIKPGKSARITLVSSYPVNGYPKDILSDMSFGGNVTSDGHTYALWFGMDDDDSELYTELFRFY